MSSGSSTANQWCTIESDPGVFTCLIESFGVKNVEVMEVYSLDDDSLQTLLRDGEVVHGLVFLFKWDKEQYGQQQQSSSYTPLVGDACPADLFFARQVTTNACATQALLSVLLNSQHLSTGKESDLSLGSTLETFQSVTSSFPPDLRGEAIAASDEIRNAHNSFCRRDDAFLVDPTIDRPKDRVGTEDAYHFVAYVPHKGKVYELDGLREGPVAVTQDSSTSTQDATATASTTTDDASNDDLTWLRIARSAIQERIERYGGAEIKFNLMALVRDRRSLLRSRAAATGDDVEAQLAVEEEKRIQWNLENERRRHNYLPFVLELLHALAATGNLPKYTQRAKDRMVQLRRAAQATAKEGVSMDDL